MLRSRWRMPPNVIDEIDDDSNINGQDQRFDCTRPVKEFIDFDWDQRSCNDDGEPFSPALQEHQADSFGEEQARIDEADNSEFANPTGREVGNFLNRAIHEPAARIEVDHRYPMFQDSTCVAVNQLECAYAGGDERGDFEQLEQADKPEDFSMGELHSENTISHESRIDVPDMRCRYRGMRMDR
jgi:hypothetical protein